MDAAHTGNSSNAQPNANLAEPAVPIEGSTLPKPDDALINAARVQDPREILVAALLNTLPGKISAEFPNLFQTPPSIRPFEGSGVAGIPFELVCAETGQRYILKIRPFSSEEINVDNPIEALKEKWIRSRAETAGVLIAQCTEPLVLKPGELPATLDTIEVRFGGLVVGGRERPYVIGIQEFVPGEPARLSIQEEKIQIRVQTELGQQLRRLHSIAVTGFGKEFDPASQSFHQNWDEYCGSLETVSKAKELEQLGILSDREVRAIEVLMTPLQERILTPVLSHLDLNAGNYMSQSDGQLTAILDWDNAGGAPWQHDVAGALSNIENSSFGIPLSSISSRVSAFLDGYGLSRDELKREKPVIDAFRTAAAVSYMHALYVTYDWAHTAEAYQAIEAGTYDRRDNKLQVIPASENDWRQAVLRSEGALKRLISTATALEGE